MRHRWVATAVVTTALLAGAQPALGWTGTHRDPDDFEIAPDIHSTTKRTFLSDSIGRRVRISVRGELGPDYRLRVLVDSMLGPKPDVIMGATVRNLELVTCRVHLRRGPNIASQCDADPFRAWWGVARRDLDPDKRIRWRIIAFGGPGLTDVTDRAPDRGWYV
jgi:hypothetical protein